MDNLNTEPLLLRELPLVNCLNELQGNLFEIQVRR